MKTQIDFSKRFAAMLTSISCCMFGILAASDAPAVAKVRVTGSGETRDGALVDACRLAVAQVHGSRVVGTLVKTNEKAGELRADADGKSITIAPVGQFVETRDQTALSFGGLLVKYALVSQTPTKDDNPLWQIVIDADVLKAIPDRFEGRVMVVTPTTASLQAKMGEASFAKKLAHSIDGWFANSLQFALLERNDETAVDGELDRAGSNTAAIAEKSKLNAAKVADVVIGVEGGELTFTERSTSFKTTSRQSHTCEVSTTLTFKALDVATKGELGRAVVELSGVKSATDPRVSKAMAIKALSDNLHKQLPVVGMQMMYHLDATRLSVAADGSLSVITPSKDTSLRGIEALRLWCRNDSGKTIELGVFELTEEGDALAKGWDTRGISEGQILSFLPISKK
jgi:hypothetical protein